MSDNLFDSLGPIDWAAHPALADDSQLDAFLADTFASAQLLIDSIPAASAPASSSNGSNGLSLPRATGRPRAQTDGAVSYFHAGGIGGDASAAGNTGNDVVRMAQRLRQMQSLRSCWKEVRVGTAGPGGSNPRNIAVFKYTAGRDGYGGSSWFARRSVHRREKRKGKRGEGDEIVLSFDAFRRGLQGEFGIVSEEDEAETTAKTDDSIKAAKVRTMEVTRHLEDRRFGGSGGGGIPNGRDTPAPSSRALHVFQLQAQFPRPTTARDFVTMLLTENSALPCSPSQSRAPRQFMVVSKPCAHPAAPPRSGYVRAQYESVELIREVLVPRHADGSRKTRSSMDLSQGDGTDLSDTPHHEMAIEWLMITRNNPGGNVPRFLVDRSTPSSIVADANQFLDWLVQQI